MPVDIPDLYSANVEAFTTCGEIATKRKKLHEWASEYGSEYYYYHHHVASGVLAVRVSLDSRMGEGKIHFHIDICGKNWFANGQLPQASENVPPLDDLLAPFDGRVVDVDLYLEFPIALSRAPSFIVVMANQAISKENVLIRMTGGVLSLDGTPIEKIRWNVDPNDENRVLVSLRSRAKLKYSNTYFRKCFDSIMAHASTLFRLDDTHV
jgi:hypothetical protein